VSRKRIAILFGGRSEEHDVSVKSAQEIADAIDTERYEPVYLGITRQGIWKLCGRPCPEWENEGCLPAVISPDRGTRGLLVFCGEEHQARLVPLDVAFPVLHGKTGEDGSIQGLLELSGIPYVGCDAQASVLCMDKSLAYTVVRGVGIATPDYWVLDCDSAVSVDIPAYPVFVKPARSGSSFGVSRVDSKDELDAAIELARRYDDKVLIEQAVIGCEVGCAVLERAGCDDDRAGTRGRGNGTGRGSCPVGVCGTAAPSPCSERDGGDGLIVGEVDQIMLSHGIFRIHQEAQPEKGSENATVTVPANLPEDKRKQIQETAKQIYRALGCRGLARIDLFVQEDGCVVLNEVNTMPGFTAYSRYPRMMAAAGIMLSEVIDRCIALALEGRRQSW
jgi:D-alanine--(R)-lactate ligase